ncbi:MAG TPA: hypothetical protein VHC86_05930 [Opitutaceae bacterium]|nr:hypothetical protein [Opitutaceae bacterium]
MKTSLRLLALASCIGLASSAAFAGTANFYVDSGQTLQIDVSGAVDSNVTLVDTDTSQTAATIFLLCGGGGWSTTYTGSASTETGVSASVGSTTYITGLPAGNYSLTTAEDGCSTDYANSSEIVDWSSDYTIEIAFELSVY